MKVYLNNREPCVKTRRASRARARRIERRLDRRLVQSLFAYERYCAEVMRLVRLPQLKMYRKHGEYESFRPIDEMIY